ncbi:hypothetical protein ABZW11_03525 [Nonomuraea sp. NPDC004580]
MSEHDQGQDGSKDRGIDQGRGDGLVIVVWHSAVCPVMDLRG